MPKVDLVFLLLIRFKLVNQAFLLVLVHLDEVLHSVTFSIETVILRMSAVLFVSQG